MITGQQQAFSVVIGDGDEQEFVIDHNLDSELCQVVVRENSTPGRLLRPDEYEVTIDSANSLTITTDAVPLEDGLAVFVVAIGPESVFQAHTHTMAQIEGLEDLLEDLGGRLEDVEGAIEIPGSGASVTPSWSSSIILPPLAEVFPATIKRGETAIVPALLRAIVADGDHDDLVPTADQQLDIPSLTTTIGHVYNLGPGARVYAPGDRRRRGRTITKADADYVTSDGYYWFAAEQGTNVAVFHPTEMNRTLWEIMITPEMLAPGRTLRVNFSFLSALLAERPELRGQYTLRVRSGVPILSETLDTGIDGVTWDSTPQILQKITLTRSAMLHEFGVVVARAANGDLSASKSVYGKATATEEPSATTFIMRAELFRWDLENFIEETGQPTGQVYLLSGDAREGDLEAINSRFPLNSEDSTAKPRLSATIS